jgi:cysteine desulfurase family protein
MSCESGEKNVIYLDNAATSFPKPESVYLVQDHISRTCCANPGRGGHYLAHQAAKIVLTARLDLARFFNIRDCAQIAFTSNATEAINVALFGLLQPGDRVVTTSMEHNAVARPLYELQQRGVEVVKVQADHTGRVTLEDIQTACIISTQLVILSHCSNVTGTLQPINEIGPWCRQQGITFMVDAAQSAGVFPIDVEAMAIDLLAAPGHKSLMGPQGVGFLYVDKKLHLKPLKYGGTGTFSSQLTQPEQMPEHLECGTLNTPALAALSAGIHFVEQVGMTAIRQHEQELTNRLRQGLSLQDKVILYGPVEAEGGVVSFNIDQRDPAEVGFLLDHHYNIGARVGLHCSPDAHRTIGSFPQGTIRISPGYFNTQEEIDCLLTAITEIIGDSSSAASV